jgi:hypothetical protein
MDARGMECDASSEDFIHPLGHDTKKKIKALENSEFHGERSRKLLFSDDSRNAVL